MAAGPRRRTRQLERQAAPDGAADSRPKEHPVKSSLAGHLRRLSLLAAATFALGLLAGAARAEEKNSAKVSYLDGKATRTSAGKASPLAKGGTVLENDLIETESGSKVELEMKDGS